MNHYLARIRKAAASLYARRHPEVRLEDITRAVGLSKVKLDVDRGFGASSPAYNYKERSRRMRPYYDSKMYDRNKIRELLDSNTPYKEIAAQVGCSSKYLSQLANQLGYPPRTFNGVSKEVLSDYVLKHPNTNLRKMARDLGYKSAESLRDRLTKLGIHLRSHDNVASPEQRNFVNTHSVEMVKASIACEEKTA